MNKGLKFLLYLLALMLIIVPTIFAFTLLIHQRMLLTTRSHNRINDNPN